jgi:hypothetical protein
MAVLQQAQLEFALTRALAVAQCLSGLHATQHMHGGLCPQALAFQSDGSVRLGPTPLGRALPLERLAMPHPNRQGAGHGWTCAVTCTAWD